MAGIKETKEAVIGAIRVGAVISSVTKDGVQFQDFGAVIAHYNSDPEFKKAVDESYEGFELIPAEVADLDVKEIIELAVSVMAELPKLVESMKA